MRTRRLLCLIAVAGVVSAEAAVIRVGPGGDVATIQAGIDLAVATPADDELRVRAGTWSENLMIPSADLGGTLEISGGWDATYATRDPDPLSTVIDGGDSGGVLRGGFIDAGNLILRGLSFENGQVDQSTGSPAGAGLYLVAVDIPVLIERCRFHSNLVTSNNGTLGANAAGAFLFAGGTAEITVTDAQVSDNDVVVSDTFGAVVGGGMVIYAQGTASMTVTGSRFTGNTTTGPGQQRGGGLALVTSDTALVEVTDSHFSGNHGSASSDGAALSATSSDGSSVDLRRLFVLGNRRDAADVSSQVYLRCFAPGDCSFRFSDSLAAVGGSGLVAEALSGTVDIVNVTLADHLEYGALGNVAPPGLGSLDNSIAWNNSVGDILLLGGGFTTQANLIGIDPLFASPASGNYRVSLDSPARDAGTATPTGGLSTLALGGNPRLSGPFPDIGAYEIEELFADGFESGDTSAWSTVVP